MKKFLYSIYTKLTAVLLIIALSAVSVFLIFNTVIKVEDRGEKNIYRFERNFKNSGVMSDLITEPQKQVSEIFNGRYGNSVISQNSDGNTQVSMTEKIFLDSVFKTLAETEGLEFYIKINSYTYTNCGAKDKNDFLNKKYYLVIQQYKNNDSDIVASNYDWSDSYYYIPEGIDVTICASVDEGYAAELEKEWNSQASELLRVLYIILALVFAAFVFFIYLICVCGKNADGELKLVGYDKIWSELNILVALLCMLIPILDGAFLKEIFYGSLPMQIACLLAVCATGTAAGIFTACFLSAVRNIKNKTFIKRFLIYKIFSRLIGSVKGAAFSAKDSGKASAVFVGLFLLYTATVGLCGIFTPESTFAFLFAVIIFIFAAFLMQARIKDGELIKKGIREIKNGNTAYKITGTKCTDYTMLADDINSIGDGINKSVEEKMKAERMKTELITNVSHDLKTPLTSIINYINLLSNVKDMPEEAVDYLKIIESKSNRLKNLTSDLFDIAKVQSGSSKLSLETLDVNVLIQQSTAEHECEINDSEITFCVNVEKDLHIKADGKKMSRVINNLISNILKYSMKNTRAFINAYSKDGSTVIEFKNISSYPMDFDSEEITERFVRGDKSRTKEGNGLGLAIAKSYTEVCGGKFEIITDGDMFKAIITFRH